MPRRAASGTSRPVRPSEFNALLQDTWEFAFHLQQDSNLWHQEMIRFIRIQQRQIFQDWHALNQAAEAARELLDGLSEASRLRAAPHTRFFLVCEDSNSFGNVFILSALGRSHRSRYYSRNRYRRVRN